MLSKKCFLYSSFVSLEELHICSNDYVEISSIDSFEHHQIKRVYISKNRLTEWKSICSLGRLFPRLETLIASENPLKTFRSDIDEVFRYLTTLSVDHVQISDWKDILELTKFPSLNTLRICSAPLLQVVLSIKTKGLEIIDFIF